MGSREMDEGTCTQQLEGFFRKRRRWRKSDGIPQEWRDAILMTADDACLARTLAKFASRNRAGARFSALLVETLGDRQWPVNVAVAIAAHLREDAPEDDGLLFQAIRSWAGKEVGVAEALLRALVLECPLETVQPDLLWACGGIRLLDPPLFVRAIQRCALLDGDVPEFAGVLFAEVADQPPEADGRIRVLLGEMRRALADSKWTREAREQALLELLRDSLNLTCVQFCRPLFDGALRSALGCIASRPWTGHVAASLAAPLVLLKDDASTLAPWVEETYRAVLADRHEPYALDICKRLADGYYRGLRRNPVIERKQRWREWAADRVASHGGRCGALGCQL